MATEKGHDFEIENAPDPYEAKAEAVQEWAEFAFYALTAPAWIILLGLLAASIDKYGPFAMFIPSALGAVGFVAFLRMAVRRFIPAVDTSRAYRRAKSRAIADIYAYYPPRR